MLQALGDDAKGEGLYAGHGLVTVVAVRHDTGESGDLRQPPAVVFPFDFNREGHARNVAFGPVVEQGGGRRPITGHRGTETQRPFLVVGA